MALRLATYNVENLFARAKALNAASFAAGEPALNAYGVFNTIAAKPKYLPEDKAAMLAALETLRVLVRTPSGGLRLNRGRSMMRGRCCGRTEGVPGRAG